MNFKKSLCFLCVSAFLFLQANAQYNLEVLDSNTFTIGEGVILHKTSFRGLSVVDDKTIWVSGSRGTIAKSVDGGKTFVYKQLKGYEKSDFRDIEAFDAKRAIIMSSGTPALILKTIDGGLSWKEVFRQNDSAYFLDAMDFWDDKRGMLVGDPINGHFVLLQTKDGGETWQELNTTQMPKAMEGEAVFAASGTSLRCWGKKSYGFVHNSLFGSSQIWVMNKYMYNPILTLDIISHSQSAGPFSFSKFKDGFVIVGGDYLNDTLSKMSSEFVLEVGKHEWQYASNYCFGYRSCVEPFSKENLVACGTTGVDVFTRPLWKSISSESFHVVRKAKKGKAVFLAGPNGKIGKLVY